MHKDFKIGMLLGLILAMAGILWLSTRSSLTPPPSAESLGSARDKFVNSEPIPSASSGLDSRSSILDARSFAADRASSIQDPGTSLNLSLHEQAEKIKTSRFHIVHKDETLSAIADKYYGSANNWQKIFQANRSRLKDANIIMPGTKLIIPD
jgi:nucleoid-associated protein YgaU